MIIGDTPIMAFYDFLTLQYGKNLEDITDIIEKPINKNYVLFHYVYHTKFGDEVYRTCRVLRLRTGLGFRWCISEGG